MRKLTWIRIRSVPVLVFDSLGVDYLKESIPSGVGYVVLTFRDQFPIAVSPGLLWLWMRAVIRLGVGFRQAYMIAMVDSHRPKVILSFADGSEFLGLYQNYRDEVLVISIQNAVRHPHEFRRLRRAPNYIALGKDALRSFHQYQIPYKRCVSSGSLPLGIFCSKNPIVKDAGKLVFVSSYRLSFDHLEGEPGENMYTKAQARAHSRIFRHALRYAVDSEMELVVLAKGKVRFEGEHFHEEREYFNQLSGGKSFTLSSTVKDTLGSYRQALTAEFIIGLDSTLLYEVFSVGAKVLFCWGADEYLLNHAQSLTEHLPTQVLLEDNNYDAFAEKVDFLRNLSEQSYSSIIAKARSEYVDTKQDRPLHETLKQEIQDHLDLV